MLLLMLFFNELQNAEAEKILKGNVNVSVSLTFLGFLVETPIHVTLNKSTFQNFLEFLDFSYFDQKNPQNIEIVGFWKFRIDLNFAN